MNIRGKPCIEIKDFVTLTSAVWAMATFMELQKNIQPTKRCLKTEMKFKLATSTNLMKFAEGEVLVQNCTQLSARRLD